MIEMRVMGIALDTRTGSPIVVLHDKDNRKALPIWIGSAEASAIIRKIENLIVARPMTHDLFLQIFEKTGHRLDRVEICDVEKDTYFAKLVLVNEETGDESEIDSRPSDAIAIAMRADAPLQRKFWQLALFLLIRRKMKKNLKNSEISFKMLNHRILQKC